MWRPKKEIKRSQKIVQKVPQVYQSDFNYCEPKQYFYLFFLIWYNCISKEGPTKVAHNQNSTFFCSLPFFPPRYQDEHLD